MNRRTFSWIIYARGTAAIFLLVLTLAPIGARAVFNPEEENPGNYNKVQDDKDRQLREGQFKQLKQEQEAAEATRRAEVAAKRDLIQDIQQGASSVDWATINRWLFNLSMVVIVGLLGYYGWKNNEPRSE